MWPGDMLAFLFWIVPPMDGCIADGRPGLKGLFGHINYICNERIPV